MPALTMRGRYLMREYWSDTDLFTKLTADQRELYQGLWMLADDDGWMPRDMDGIGAALYRFMDRDPRIGLVRDGIDRLRRLKKLESYRCGCIFLPAVSRYPRAGKKSTEHHDVHASHSKGFDDSGSKHQKDLNGFEPIQKDLNGFEPIQKDLNPSPVPSSSSSLPDPSSRARAPEGGATLREKAPWPLKLVAE